MSTTIAGYYLDELVDWIQLIGFYNREIIQFGNKLAEVIQRNTIPNIAEKVEAQQGRLNEVAVRFGRLHKHIEKQHSKLKVDHTLIDNKLINAETEKRQNELRQEMEQSEKIYVDVKYACYHFLSETLKKQK
ncbi:MAG: hypothetical protein Q8891_07810 [Bacteroidota bacterium]|nr:hypothetical protein [Bacteroidota bacterium]